VLPSAPPSGGGRGIPTRPSSTKRLRLEMPALVTAPTTPSTSNSSKNSQTASGTPSNQPAKLASSTPNPSGSAPAPPQPTQAEWWPRSGGHRSQRALFYTPLVSAVESTKKPAKAKAAPARNTKSKASITSTSIKSSPRNHKSSNIASSRNTPTVQITKSMPPPPQLATKPIPPQGIASNASSSLATISATTTTTTTTPSAPPVQEEQPPESTYPPTQDILPSFPIKLAMGKVDYFYSPEEGDALLSSSSASSSSSSVLSNPENGAPHIFKGDEGAFSTQPTTTLASVGGIPVESTVNNPYYADYWPDWQGEGQSFFLLHIFMS